MPSEKRITYWGGGPHHPTREQAAWLERETAADGTGLRYMEDLGAFDPAVLARTDLLVLAGLNEEARLGEAGVAALTGYLGRGKPLLVHHAGLVSFQPEPALAEIYDGRWVTGRSSHAPAGEIRVQVNKGHALTKGLADFTVVDERYQGLIQPSRSGILLRAEGLPLAWAGTYGPARVAVCALGHDMKAYESPGLRDFLLRCARWLMNEREEA